MIYSLDMIATTSIILKILYGVVYPQLDTHYMLLHGFSELEEEII